MQPGSRNTEHARGHVCNLTMLTWVSDEDPLWRQGHHLKPPSARGPTMDAPAYGSLDPSRLGRLEQHLVCLA